MKPKFDIGNTVVINNYPDKNKIPKGTVGFILDIFDNHIIEEEYGTTLYLVDTPSLPPLVKGYVGQLILEHEMELKNNG